MGNRLKEDYLKELQKYDTPAIANAIETLRKNKLITDKEEYL